MQTPPPASEALAPGAVLDGFRLESELGEGGSGIVFRAVEVATGTPVALKVLRARLASDPVVRRRFEHEVRVAERLRAPHLVALIATGLVDDRPFLVSQLMTGGSMASRLQQGGPIEIGEAARLLGQVAEALDVLHAAGVVHRDVTLGNVMLNDRGDALLGDLGLARSATDTALTRPGQMLGTAGYLAPELIRGGTATVASDLYALGCVTFAMVTGAVPFANLGLIRAAFAHLEADPPDPAVGHPDWAPGVSPAIRSALAKDPAARPPWAGAYAAAIQAAVTG